MRVLIPLAYPIDSATDHTLIEAFLLDTINKDAEYIDKTFMHMHRYFAHGTSEVSSFIGNKEMLDWKMLPGLTDFKQKLEKKNKKKQHVIHVKEIRVRPNTGDHDLLTKLSRAKKFLEAGDKVKITVMYRGREMARQDMGIQTLNRVVEILDDFAQIDKQANLEGRRLSLILSPK